jgi:S-adenosyl-L-methionine hydrolase (adenosine-forming)
MTTPPPIITLLTDFGDHDGYVGAMKGVMLTIAPNAQLVDISHQVSPQNVRQAAQILARAYSYFPPYTVHLVVVDPGVGSDRQPIALKTGSGYFIAPDNGVLTYVQQREKSWTAIRLDREEYWLPQPSNTFHGRDIFSPAAAHLAKGIPFENLGTPLQTPVELSLPPLTVSSTSAQGKVIHIDHFGNVITNIMPLTWVDDQRLNLLPVNAEPIQVDRHKAYATCGWHTLKGLRRSYSEVQKGEPIILVGSNGELEIAINQGNAAESLALEIGDPVTLHFGS